MQVTIVDLFRYGYLKPTIFIWGSYVASNHTIIIMAYTASVGVPTLALSHCLERQVALPTERKSESACASLP